MNNPIPEPDRRATVESRLLAVISGYGGEVLVADNPRVALMVDELADETERLSFDGMLPAPAPPFAGRVAPRPAAPEGR